MVSAEDSIDLQRYPIHQPGSAGFNRLLESVHKELERQGCAKLDGFVKPMAARALQEEGDRVACFAHRSFNRVNPYFTSDDEEFPPDHPRRRFNERSNAFVPADNFGDESLLRAIYEWPSFTDFIRRSLKEKEASFYRYDDPLADVIINVVDPGGGFPWHFDTNTYTVTLGIQPAERGGLFQYCPKLRSEDSENYDQVAAVMDGDQTNVRSLELQPGDLQIFLGRYSLHQVTAVEGSLSRYVGIFSYANEPGMCGRVERTRQLYGRVLPVHLERDKKRRADALQD
jgi:hypothetical protein